MFRRYRSILSFDLDAPALIFLLRHAAAVIIITTTVIVVVVVDLIIIIITIRTCCDLSKNKMSKIASVDAKHLNSSGVGSVFSSPVSPSISSKVNTDIICSLSSVTRGNFPGLELV